MRNALAGLFFAVLLSGCASQTVYEAAVGANVTSSMPWSQGRSGGFAGPQDVAHFAVRTEYQNGVFVEWRHLSHFSAGAPFNDKPEDWVDSINVGYRFVQRH
jgi:hypothetical protein